MRFFTEWSDGVSTGDIWAFMSNGDGRFFDCDIGETLNAVTKIKTLEGRDFVKEVSAREALDIMADQTSPINVAFKAFGFQNE